MDGRESRHESSRLCVSFVFLGSSAILLGIHWQPAVATMFAIKIDKTRFHAKPLPTSRAPPHVHAVTSDTKEKQHSDCCNSDVLIRGEGYNRQIARKHDPELNGAPLFLLPCSLIIIHQALCAGLSDSPINIL
jgi:hypothetical protein